MSIEDSQHKLLNGLEAELISLDQRRMYIAQWIVELKAQMFGEQMVIEEKPNIGSAWDY